MDDVRRTRRTMAQDANRTKTSTRMVVSDDNALVSRSFVGVMAMSRCDVGSGGATCGAAPSASKAAKPQRAEVQVRRGKKLFIMLPLPH